MTTIQVNVNKMFMDEDSVRECIATIKLKNTEGFDRIPQRILVDGASVLTKPMCELFSKIYYQRAVPKQWLVSKTMPIFKNKCEKRKFPTTDLLHTFAHLQKN